MADQAAQETGEQTSVEAAATAPQAVEAAAGIDAPSIAPDHEAPPKPDPVTPDAPRVEPPRIEASRIEVPKFSATPQAESRPEPKPGKLIVMPPSDRAWDREDFAPHVKADEPREAGGKRRLSAMAAVVAIAASVGAISGVLATAGMMHFAAPVPAPAQVADTSALDASVARIDADLVALKANVEHTSKTGLNQFNRANDRTVVASVNGRRPPSTFSSVDRLSLACSASACREIRRLASSSRMVSAISRLCSSESCLSPCVCIVTPALGAPF
ncbi:hypothetical protein ABIF34_007642 [Bradyrhizobium japonicum]